MLVLSVYVARSAGAGCWRSGCWRSGLVRYVFAMAGWVLPWMRAQLPPRYWRKVVTATAGIALVVRGGGHRSPEATYAALAVALVLLAESFGRDVWWLWRHRPDADRPLRRQAAERSPMPVRPGAVAMRQDERTRYDAGPASGPGGGVPAG